MNAFSKPFEHSWQRHPKHLFYEDLPFIAYTPISNFIPLLSPPPTHTHPPFRLKLPTLTALSVISFLWLNGWLRHIWCVILLKDIMVLHIPSFCTLVPEGRSCVFYATRHQVYWGLIQVSFCWYSDLFDITHTNTQHTQRPVDWHTHINIYFYHLLCAQCSYLCYTEWIIHWNLKIYCPQCFLRKIIHFEKERREKTLSATQILRISNLCSLKFGHWSH